MGIGPNCLQEYISAATAEERLTVYSESCNNNPAGIVTNYPYVPESNSRAPLITQIVEEVKDHIENVQRYFYLALILICCKAQLRPTSS